MSSLPPFLDAKARIEAANLVPPEFISWPNENFDQPAADTPAWIAVNMTSTVLRPITLPASDIWQENGILWVHIFVPWGTGTDNARTLSKTVCNAFRGLEPSSIYYLEASIDDGGREENTGLWWRQTVTIEWRYQDINT